MSKKTTKTVLCPSCQKPINIDVFSSYNFQEENCDIDPLLSDEWISHKCPNCGNTFIFLDVTIFHDMEKKFIVFFFPKGDFPIEDSINVVNKAGIPSDYTIRIVKDSYASFKEKILVLESGLNDLACEIYKWQIVEDYNLNPNCELRIVIKEDLVPKGVVVLSGAQKPLAVPFDMNLYKKSLSEISHYRAASDYVVDRNTLNKIEGELPQ